MESKSHISKGTKKILVGVGVGFGTVLVFIVSFFLSFSFIINPISFVPVGDSELAEENEELKSQVQTLEDEVELLNTRVERYKNSVTETVPMPDTPQTTTTPQGSTQQSTTSGSGGAVDSGLNQDEEFSPETVTTPETGIVPEVEPDITIIDISE